jgi:hypothetical protein
MATRGACRRRAPQLRVASCRPKPTRWAAPGRAPAPAHAACRGAARQITRWSSMRTRASLLMLRGLTALQQQGAPGSGLRSHGERCPPAVARVRLAELASLPRIRGVVLMVPAAKVARARRQRLLQRSTARQRCRLGPDTGKHESSSRKARRTRRARSLRRVSGRLAAPALQFGRRKQEGLQPTRRESRLLDFS